jgi:hypothetical protein
VASPTCRRHSSPIERIIHIKRHKHHHSPDSLPVGSGFADASVDAFNALRAGLAERRYFALLEARRAAWRASIAYLGCS